MTGSWPEVEVELQEQGFVADGANGYVGRLAGVAVRLRLPPAFPFAMPKISVEEPAFPLPFPHVEELGAVCLGPSEGLLLDVGRPAAIVSDALVRATRILQAKDGGLRGRAPRLLEAARSQPRLVSCAAGRTDERREPSASGIVVGDR